MKTKFFALLIFLGPALMANQKSTCAKWEVVDIPFTAENAENPFEVNFGAIISHKNGTQQNIPGFYNDDNTWIIRFCPDLEGKYSYTTYATLPELSGKTGTIEVSPNTKKDEHGPVVISKENPQKFSYADETPYFAAAYELDWLFALDWDNKKDIPKTKQIVKTVKENKFNQLVLNVYAYSAGWGEKDKILPEHNFAEPEVFPFGGSNENPDYSVLNIDFFKHFDRVIEHLNEQEIISHLMIYVWNKRVNWPEPGSKADNLYFDYVVKRYQAFPNLIWDISKEALLYGRDNPQYITERIDRLKKLDGHNRLLSVHDYRYCLLKPEKLDFISVQAWVPNLYSFMYSLTQKYPNKPIFNIEHGGYEKTRHSIYDGSFTDPVACLDRNYKCAFAGAYSTYYWQNTSWYEVVYNMEDLPEKEQPKLAWHKNMIQLFEDYNYHKLEPIQEEFLPYCLSDHESVYLFYVPERMIKISGNLPELKGKKIRVCWYDLFTGKTYEGYEREFKKGTFLNFKRDENITSPMAIAILKII